MTIRVTLGVVAGLALASAAAQPAVQASPGADYRGSFAALEKRDFVPEGATNAKSIVYVFFDANCLYCHLTWKALQPYEPEGLQVRWVPVAYQKPSSVGRAAAIMQASDRVAALRSNESGYRTAELDGGIRPLVAVAPGVRAQLEANTRLMNDFGAPGTPALVWRDRDGRIRVKVGVPRLSELPRITRLPLQPNDDPELAQFR